MESIHAVNDERKILLIPSSVNQFMGSCGKTASALQIYPHLCLIFHLTKFIKWYTLYFVGLRWFCCGVAKSRLSGGFTASKGKKNSNRE